MFSLFFLGKDDPKLQKNGPFAPFTAAHIIVLLLVFLLIYLLIRFARKKKYHTRLLWVCGAYALMVLLNIVRLAWELDTGEFDVRESLPLHLCGLQMFSLPFALFSRGKAGSYMREFVFAYGTLGFLLALLLPFTTMYDYPVWHFRTMQSVLYHAALGFAALMLPHIDYNPDIKNVRKAYGVLSAAILLTGGVNLLTDSNYLYTASLPLPTQVISWPYYLPLLFAFAYFIGRLPYVAHHHLIGRAYHRNVNAPQNQSR